MAVAMDQTAWEADRHRVSWPFHRERQTVTREYLTPAWHVDVTRDRFTGQLRCRLYQGRHKLPMVIYYRSSLAFQFAPRLNTTSASFRVDNGAVRPWSAVYPQLVGVGAPLSGRSMDNPTQGRVLIPLTVLSGGHVVTVRPTPNRRPQLFGIDGFGDAMGSARGQGCDPVNGFAP